MTSGTNSSGNLFNTSLTTHGSLFANTGGVIDATTVGTLGHVLMSNGGGTPPSFQAVTASGAITTIDGDTGSATGSPITFDANSNSGSSVKFIASGSTVDLKVTDANGNTIIGSLSGNGTLSNVSNSGFGSQSLTSLTTGAFNTADGFKTLNALTSGQSNTAIGNQCLQKLTTTGSNCGFGDSSLSQLVTGTGNIAIGLQSGSNYTTSESANILIGNLGVIGENFTTRIGRLGLQTSCFVAGIQGVTVSNLNIVTINTSTGQMGSEATVAVANGGTGAATLTGILTGNGTSAVTATAVTQYDVLVGGATNTVSSVSPSTAGFILTSNGVSANPSFQIPAIIGSLTYFFTNTASDVAAELQQTLSTFTPKTTQSFAGLGAGNTLLETFITNASNPNLSFLPAGTYEMHVHADQTVGTRNTALYAEIWEATTLGVDIAKIGTTGVSANLTGSEIEYFVDFSLGSVYTFASTASRIKTKLFASGAALGSNSTVNIFVGDEADSHISLPGPIADVTNFVPYTGAVKSVNLGPNSITALSATLTNPLTVPNGGTGAATLTGVLTGNGASTITANTVTQHGVVIGGASNAVSSTAVGSTGQVLQANTGADPTYSTATFPSTATGTGTILRADGTNWTATTATYPTTTTSQQLLYSSAANTIGGLTTGNSLLAATNSAGTLAMRAFSVNDQVFTSTGTYTPTTGMLYCTIQCLGGGGGGGGAQATAGATGSCGGGGGSGEYAAGQFSAATVGASQAVTIGAAGAANSGAGGGAGGNTSVGALISANGGAGGATGAASAIVWATGGSGGSGGAGGNYRANGNSGTSGFASVPQVILYGGNGAGSQLGGMVVSTAGGVNVTGVAGGAFGGGGSGGYNYITESATSGGAGAKGVVIITEYIIN